MLCKCMFAWKLSPVVFKVGVITLQGDLGGGGRLDFNWESIDKNGVSCELHKSIKNTTKWQNEVR